jgi:hypothetical protein
MIGLTTCKSDIVWRLAASGSQLIDRDATGGLGRSRQEMQSPLADELEKTLRIRRRGRLVFVPEVREHRLLDGA